MSQYLTYSDRVLIFLARYYQFDTFHPILHKFIGFFIDIDIQNIIAKELLLINVDEQPELANKLITYQNISALIKQVPIDRFTTNKKKIRKARKTARKKKELTLAEIEELRIKTQKELNRLLDFSDSELLEDINLKDV